MGCPQVTEKKRKVTMASISMLSLNSVFDNEDDSTADSDAISWADDNNAVNMPGKPQENMPMLMNGIFLAVIMEFFH